MDRVPSSSVPAHDTLAKPLLQFESVSVHFGGIVALDEVSFDVYPGQICALIGPNGAGKSTLFNCLSRIYDSGKGRIRLEGQVISRLARHQMAEIGIGRTFQNLALFGTLSVLDNVLIGGHAQEKPGFLLAMLGLGGSAANASQELSRAQTLIDFLKLDPYVDWKVSDLPFAIQKRVELARALMARPKLLLLDEPACGLNHEELESLASTIADIRDRMGITVLLVEHHMSLVMSIADQVVVLNFGRKIAQGSPAQVRSHPGVIDAYLGS